MLDCNSWIQIALYSVLPYCCAASVRSEKRAQVWRSADVRLAHESNLSSKTPGYRGSERRLERKEINRFIKSVYLFYSCFGYSSRQRLTALIADVSDIAEFGVSGSRRKTVSLIDMFWCFGVRWQRNCLIYSLLMTRSPSLDRQATVFIQVIAQNRCLTQLLLSVFVTQSSQVVRRFSDS